jgi:hypothetical protein
MSITDSQLLDALRFAIPRLILLIVLVRLLAFALVRVTEGLKVVANAVTTFVSTFFSGLIRTFLGAAALAALAGALWLGNILIFRSPVEMVMLVALAVLIWSGYINLLRRRG